MGYRVIVEGRVLPERNRAEVLAALADIFHSTPAHMERLLAGVPVPLKRSYPPGEAEAIRARIEAAGARCRVEAEEMTVDLPAAADAGEPVTGEEAAPAAGAAAGEDVSRPGTGRQAGVLPESTPTRAELEQFIGPNADRYLRAFERFGDPPRFVPGWHWPAFFFFTVWAMYRGLWFWALVHVLGSFVLTPLLSGPAFVSGVLIIAWMVSWPLVANWLYFRAVHIALAARAAGQAGGWTAARGGVSRPAAWLTVLVLAVWTVFTSHAIDWHLLRLGRLADAPLVLGPDSQLRGDGTPLGSLSGQPPAVAITSFTLVSLGGGLSLAMAQGDEAVDTLVEKIQSGEFTDGWDLGVRIREEVDRYVLVSGGPDGAFGTADDLLQPVPRQ